MAVFRVPKNKDYTIMANHHLRDKTLSLKAKGLLSLMLSLPEDWDYTLRGLAAICRDGTESIGAAVKELEAGGYIERRQIRNEKGHFVHWEYTILEKPKRQNPDTEKPDTGNPDTEKPDTEKPYQENPAQLNTKESSTEELNTDSLNTYLSNQEEAPQESELKGKSSGLGTASDDGMDEEEKREAYLKLIRKNIDYDILLQIYPFSQAQIDGFIDLMLDTLNCRSPTILIGGSEIPSEVVKSRLLKLNMGHFQYILDSMQKNTTKVANIRKYMLAALYNAPATMDSYYVSQVNHDREKDGKKLRGRIGRFRDYRYTEGESL